MKILVIGSRIPYPQRDGGAIATFGMLKELAAQGQEVTYFTFNTKKHFIDNNVIDREFDFCRVIPVYLDATPKIIPAIVALVLGKNYNIQRFVSEKANAELEKLLNRESFDIIHFESLFSTTLYNTVKRNSQSVFTLRQHNVEYKIWEKMANHTANPIKKWYLSQLAKTLRKYEQEIILEFNNIIPISPEDERFFKRLNPNANYLLFPAGVKLDLDFVAEPKQPFTLCHLGSMEWMPNVEAVEWFISNIWPSILNKFPQSTFHIAGKGLNSGDLRFDSIGVYNHGEVSSASAFLSKYSAVVVPLQSGSGLRMKTLEAMAMGIPVISTSTGASGLEYENGKTILIADSPEEWLSQVEAVFTKPEIAMNIGGAAKEMVAEKYSTPKLAKALISFYSGIIQKGTNQ